MTKKVNRKSSARRKLIPAVGMLTVSAMMLSSATYAWFTMSREVEVQNIQMTATTPEDIQISLGKVAGADGSTASAVEAYSLANSTGWLVNDDGVVTAPRENLSNGSVVANQELDWSNIADISAYYEFGKLIPASSTDGLNIFFTPNAAGVGRSLSYNAKFYQAATAKNATLESAVGGSGNGTLNATAHVLSNTEIRPATGNATGWVDYTANTAEDKYVKSTDWNATGSDGYYIDIPVWLRTSSTKAGGTPVYISGYVTSQTVLGQDDTLDKDEDDLYKAVRVAVLSTSVTNSTESYAADGGLLTLADGLDSYIDPATATEIHQGKFPTWTGFANILDSDNYSGDGTNTNRSKTTANGTGRGGTDGKLYGVSAVGTNNIGATWTEITTTNNGSAPVATLPVGTGTAYGDSVKVIIRVWLEGEDGNCWNANAGQDWNIALKFSKEALPTTAPSNGSGNTGT